jgi:hypothetical protein
MMAMKDQPCEMCEGKSDGVLEIEAFDNPEAVKSGVPTKTVRVVCCKPCAKLINDRLRQISKEFESIGLMADGSETGRVQH